MDELPSKERDEERHHKKKHKHRSRSRSRDKDRSKKEKKRHRSSRDNDDVGKDSKESKVEEASEDKREVKDKDRVSERDLIGGSRRSSERERDRYEREGDRRGDRDRVREREKDRERDNRDRDKDRERESEKAVPRDRWGEDERRRDRSNERDRPRRDRDGRDADRDRGKSSRESARDIPPMDTDTSESLFDRKRPTLTDILRENPGMSMADAIQRLHAVNVASTGDYGSETAAIAMSHAAMTHMNATTGVVGEGGSATKNLREVYVGNLPPGVSVPQLIEFMNAAMRQLGVTSTRGSVVSAWVSTDGHYGFTEFSTIEECNAAIAYLNGFQMGSVQLKVGRPSGFKASAGMSTSTGSLNVRGAGLGVLSGMLGAGGGAAFSGGIGSVLNPLAMGSAGAGIVGVGTESKPEYEYVIILMDIPSVLDRDSLQDIISPFGQDAHGETQSVVFRYADTSVTDAAVKALGSIALGNQKLSAQIVPTNLAPILIQSNSDDEKGKEDEITEAASTTEQDRAEDKDAKTLAAMPPSTVLRFARMTTEEDLINDMLYAEMIDDVLGECRCHGEVKSAVAPRDGEGRGLVFTHFETIEAAVKMKEACDNRTFNGQDITITFFPETLMLANTYFIPESFVLIPKSQTEDLD